MAPTGQVWWTDEQVAETVDSAYVHAQLRPNEQLHLKKPLYFGGDLTDDTYLDWILTKARRFFLILVDSGVPEQIFGIVDDSFDDDDLPIAEERVPDLHLSREPDRVLDRRFYRAQFRYLARSLEEGDFIHYAEEESVPIHVLGFKTAVVSLGRDGIDKVKVASQSDKVFVRKKIVLNSNFTQIDALQEIAGSKSYSHEHLVSVFASYLQQQTLCVLLTPAPDHSLKQFLSDSPKAFEAISKLERRKTYLTWLHCLSTAVSWLHVNGQPHGAIRPSNIQIDSNFRVALGQLEGTGILDIHTREDDIEAYQYAAPERWKRAVTIQAKGAGKVALQSGGRTSTKISVRHEKNASVPSNNHQRSKPHLGGAAAAQSDYTFLPTSKGAYSRLRLSTALGPDAGPTARQGRPNTALSARSQATVRARRTTDSDGRSPSAVSSRSSGSRKYVNPASSSPIFLAAPESRATVLQTWQSVQHDSYAADVFSLGAVFIDILSVLCKRGFNSFARHRSAKNRTAGRGGGLADASFHANLGQVDSWVELIKSDAAKRIKKEDGQLFSAVGPVIQLAQRCLDREPESRLVCEDLHTRIGEHLQQFAGFEHLHCRITPTPRETPTPTAELEATSPIDEDLGRTADEFRPSMWPIPPKSEYSNRGFQGLDPIGSVSSLSSFDFDLGGRAESALSDNQGSQVGEEPDTRLGHVSPHTGRGRVKDDTFSFQRWGYHHNNDSAVDPRLSLSDGDDAAKYSYHLGYSTSESSEGDSRYMSQLLNTLRPPTAAPDRDLPPVPQQVSSPAISRFSQATTARVSSRRDGVMMGYVSVPQRSTPVPSMRAGSVRSPHHSSEDVPNISSRPQPNLRPSELAYRARPGY